MALSKSELQSLKIINNTLKKEHGFTVTLDESISKNKLQVIRNQFIEEQRELSYTKDVQGNPEYSQCALVLEATNILLGEKPKHEFMFSESNSTKVDELERLESLLETVKEKQPEKAKALTDKINAMRDKIYAESKGQELTQLLKESAQQAEVIMAARNLFDNVQGFQSKIGDLMNKQLDPFIERVRTVYGADVADKMYSNMEETLSELMSQVRQSKEVFYNSVGVLTGEGGDLDDSVDDSEISAGKDLETDDFEDESTSDDSDEGLGDMDLNLDDIEDEGEEEFTRKEE